MRICPSRLVTLPVLALVFASAAHTRAADDEYLNYAIPPTAKREQLFTRETKFGYYDDQHRLIAEETCQETPTETHIVQRKLFKDGKPHGVQSTWRFDGSKESAKPYKNGVMEG